MKTKIEDYLKLRFKWHIVNDEIVFTNEDGRPFTITGLRDKESGECFLVIEHGDEADSPRSQWDDGDLFPLEGETFETLLDKMLNELHQ